MREPGRHTVWLELGNNNSGLCHIMNRHAAEFEPFAPSEAFVAEHIFAALSGGRIVGYQNAAKTRPIIEYTLQGQTRRIAITVGPNGYVVGANPKSRQDND